MIETTRILAGKYKQIRMYIECVRDVYSVITQDLHA